MVIDGFEKLTLLDYPEKIACILFTRGCNLRCPFCQNSLLLTFNKSRSEFSEEDIFKYLEKRKNILDGVCISGGEPLLQPDVKEFIKNIKKMNLSVKIDTNGTNYNKLKELIDEKLVDYVAMDIKNAFEKYSITTGIGNLDLENIKKSISLLKKGDVDYEFRTTVIKDFHKFEDIENICKIIGKNSKYYLQNFVDSENVLQKNLSGYTEEELKKWIYKLKINYNLIKLRG